MRKGASPPTGGRGHLPGSVSAGWAEKQEGQPREGSPATSHWLSLQAEEGVGSEVQVVWG